MFVGILKRIDLCMKIDIRDLEILYTIERLGTFAKAAKYLHRTPSAITQSVQKLERLVNFKIFDRSTYTLKFTSEGRLLMERGQNMLKQMERLENELHLIQKGWPTEFGIAFDDLLSCEGVFSVLNTFQKQSPMISIKVYREVMNGSWDALIQNRAVLVLGVSGEPPPELPCAQMDLGIVSFVFAISPQHPLAQRSEPLNLEDLASAYSIVISDTAENVPGRTSGTYPGQSIIVVPHMEAKIQAQVQGLGVGYLPKHRIEHLLQEGLLVERTVARLKTKVALKIAWRTDANSDILDWFLEHLQKQDTKNNLLRRSKCN